MNHGAKTRIVIPLPTVGPFFLDPRPFPVGEGFPFDLIDPATVRIFPSKAYRSGYLRSIDVTVTDSGPEAPYERPHAAAERTRSRRALAGSRRARRHPVRRRGPSGRAGDDSPFTSITGYDLYAANRFGKVS